MGGPAFTNNMITKVKLGTSNVTKLYLGHNKAWPPPISRSAFEFDTIVTAGTLEFTVVADEQWVACVINDVDMFLVERVGGTVSSVRATTPDVEVQYGKGSTTLPGLDKTFSLGGANYKIPVKIPLYKKDIVSIRGNHSRATRYNVDQKKGSIAIDVTLGISIQGQYRVSITGATTQTKNVNVSGLFQFNNLTKGTKTITITNLADNTSSTTTVVINTSSKAINPKSVTLASVATFSTETSSDTLTNIKVYALTDAEAQLNLQNAYGNEASISILCDLFFVGHSKENDDYAGGTGSESWHLAHNYFKINHGGYGYPPNATIQCRINNVYTYAPVFKGSIYEYQPFYMFNMYTDSNGTITSIGAPTSGSYRVQSFDWIYHPDGKPIGEFGHRFNPLGKDTINRQDTNNFSALNYGGKWYDFPNGSKANDLAWDWWYASITDTDWYARQYKRGQWDYTPRGNDATTMIQEAIETNRFELLGHNNKPIAIRFENTGTNVFNNTGQFFENLIFESEDGIGNIKAVDLANVDIEEVRAVRQKELIAVKSKVFQTYHSVFVEGDTRGGLYIPWRFVQDGTYSRDGLTADDVSYSSEFTGSEKLRVFDTPEIKYVYGESVTWTYS